MVASGCGCGSAQRYDLSNGLITIQHEDGFATPDVVNVPREIVLQLGNPGFLHIAIIANTNDPKQSVLTRWSSGTR